VSGAFGAGEGADGSLGLTDHVPAAELRRLQDELVVARAEIARLKEENDRLRLHRPEAATASVHRSQRAPRLFASTEEVLVGVDGSSPAQDKIRLFRSLFAGRADVYAQRWENEPKKNSGWSPVLLDGRQAQVPRRYAPLDDEVVGAHLSGRITAGVYPLIDGDRCCFLACDFDKGSWLLDALAFLEVCNDVGVPACLERSRSGNGAHVWVFFDQPVKAAVARRLGTGLLRETMALRVEVDLTSYDRLFLPRTLCPRRVSATSSPSPSKDDLASRAMLSLSTRRGSSRGLTSGRSSPRLDDCLWLRPKASATPSGSPPVLGQPSRRAWRARDGPGRLRRRW